MAYNPRRPRSRDTRRQAAKMARTLANLLAPGARSKGSSIQAPDFATAQHLLDALRNAGIPVDYCGNGLALKVA